MIVSNTIIKLELMQMPKTKCADAAGVKKQNHAYDIFIFPSE